MNKQHLALILGLIVVGLIGFYIYTSQFSKPPIVDHFACSDYCPGPTEDHMVKIYQGVTDPDECKKIGGTPSTYYGWGEFHICLAK